MNPLTREALEWLVKQDDFLIERDGATCEVRVGHTWFADRNTEDAILAAYETLHVKPALRDDRTTLPDYGNEGVLHEHMD